MELQNIQENKPIKKKEKKKDKNENASFIKH